MEKEIHNKKTSTQMKISRLNICNFRGIKSAELYFNGHSVLVGDNNVGKSTIIEAIDLVLGPERLSRYPVIDEHDFFAGDYIGIEGVEIQIEIEIVIIDLNEEQLRHFRSNIEWWDSENLKLIDNPPVNVIDNPVIFPSLRVCFKGHMMRKKMIFRVTHSFAHLFLMNWS